MSHNWLLPHIPADFRATPYMLIIPAYYLFPASLAWVNIFSWFADLICVLCMGKGRESVYCNVLDLLSSLSEQDI